MRGRSVGTAVPGNTETEIRALVQQGATTDATTLALRTFGPELLRFLAHVHRDEQIAQDVFADVAEDVWRGLPAFRWESSFRTWAYRLARTASSRQRRRQRRLDRFVPLSAVGPLSELVESIRTRTVTALRSESRTKLDQLRDELEVEERMLLVLRIDRGLPWDDVARVLRDGSDGSDGSADRAPDARDVARLRKRFQLLKDRLKRRGRDLGLIASEES